jgi:hypothetical protein
MSEFATWEELSPLEQARELWWDMYKDANGFRPRGIDTSAWTLDDFNKEFEFLGSQIEAAAIEREKSQERASHDFEMRIPCVGHTKPRALTGTTSTCAT